MLYFTATVTNTCVKDHMGKCTLVCLNETNLGPNNRMNWSTEGGNGKVSLLLSVTNYC